MNKLTDASGHVVEVRTLRVENLRRLIQEHGGTTQLSKLLKYSNASYLSQMTSKSPTRGITEASARKMEALMHLPVGWMDQRHERRGSVSQPTPAHTTSARLVNESADDASALDVALLTRCVKGVLEVYASTGGQPDPSRIAGAVAVAYLTRGDGKLIAQIANLI